MKYISTTLPYINSLPHIGHAFEFVLADVIAQYHRHKLGTQNVFFNVGVDEHGQKVYNKSVSEGYKNPQQYCNEYTQKWVDFCKLLHINYDNFYRTSSKQHALSVQKFARKLNHSALKMQRFE